MAKITRPPAKSRKGAPPPMAGTVANLDKPEQPPALKTLNLKVPVDFKRELKVYAAQQGRSMTDLLMEGYRLLREQRG